MPDDRDNWKDWDDEDIAAEVAPWPTRVVADDGSEHTVPRDPPFAAPPKSHDCAVCGVTLRHNETQVHYMLSTGAVVHEGQCRFIYEQRHPLPQVLLPDGTTVKIGPMVWYAPIYSVVSFEKPKATGLVDKLKRATSLVAKLRRELQPKPRNTAPRAVDVRKPWKRR